MIGAFDPSVQCASSGLAFFLGERPSLGLKRREQAQNDCERLLGL
jgi:hypothetical protein